jgi:hypothetical protein
VTKSGLRKFKRASGGQLSRQSSDRFRENQSRLEAAAATLTGETSVRLPPICFMTLSTIASPRPPPAPTVHPRTKGFFRVSRVSDEMTAPPLSRRICRSRPTTISIGSRSDALRDESPPGSRTPLRVGREIDEVAVGDAQPVVHLRYHLHRGTAEAIAACATGLESERA